MINFTLVLDRNINTIKSEFVSHKIGVKNLDYKT